MRARRRADAGSTPELSQSSPITVEVRGQHLNAWTSTNAPHEGEPVYVLIHGIGTSHQYFERLRHELGTDASVWSLDMPGFGGTSKPKKALNVNAMATVLGEVFDRLGITNAVVVGHSMGAQWGTELAIARPDLIRGVALIGAVVDERRNSFFEQAFALVVDSRGESIRTNAIVFGDYWRCGPVWFLRQLRHMFAYRIAERLKSVNVPVLVMRGENDPVAPPRWSEYLANCVADGELAVIRGQRHVAQHTAPGLVAAALRTFARRCVPPK